MQKHCHATSAEEENTTVETSESRTTKSLIRHCPVCQCKYGEILHTQKFALSENILLPKEYDVVSCNKCGFIYADTSASQNDYDKFYIDQSKYEDTKTGSGGGLNDYDKKRLSETATYISSICKNKDASIIDIGCANGGLLQELKQLAYKNIIGYDPSKKCTDFVNSIGIKCINGSLFDIPDKIKEKFDIVILSHVMEHVRDIEYAMQILVSLLRDGGKLYIEVPDAGKYHEFYKSPYYYFDIEHINHFDKFSLKNLGTVNNLNTLFIKCKSIPVCENEFYPAIFAVYSKIPLIYSTDAKNAIKKHISISASEIQKENLLIKPLVKSQEPVMIFGIGSFTQRLLATTDLSKCNIKCFLDNDKTKQNRTYCYKNIVKKIEDPQILKDFDGMVVICSALFSKEIEKEVLELNPKLKRIVCK
jgi:SAM-dependent methyltransferase